MLQSWLLLGRGFFKRCRFACRQHEDESPYHNYIKYQQERMRKEEKHKVPERNLVELQMVNPAVMNGIRYIVFLLSLTHNVIRTSVL